ncbi:MAG TPA: hypothetical protein DCQ58_06600 [Saprospirales bacterium]|nr:hypothetical protein [Saprospirales bacterium]
MANMKIERQEPKPVSQYLLGFYQKNIPWWPFIILALMLAIIIGIASSINLGFSPYYIPAGMVAIFIAFVVFQKPEIGAYILIISVFTNISDILTDRGLPSINRPLIALTMGSVIANYYMKTGRYSRFPKLTNSEWALLGYYFAAIISVLILPDKSDAFGIIFDITKDILVGICIFIILNTQERWKAGLNILVVTVTILAAMGVFKTATGSEITFFDMARNSLFGQVGEENELRYGGPIGEPNLWGQVLVSTIPLIFYRVLQAKSVKDKTILLISLGLVFLAMIFTGSRGAIVALIAMMLLIAIELKIRPSQFVMACILFIVIFAVLPENYQRRFGSLNIFSNNELQQDDAVSSRSNAMLVGLKMFNDNPILGVGFGHYRSNYWEYAISLGLESNATNITDYDENAHFVHSLYIEILSETGLVGFLTFALFIGALLSGLYKIRHKLKDSPLYKDFGMLIIALAMSIFTFLVSGFFLHGVFYRYIWVLIGLAMAAISISNDIRIIPFARQSIIKELHSKRTI